MPNVVVAGLFVYPVKSLGGVALTEARVERRGLRFDRRWMIVNEDGVFITQRENWDMGRIAVTIGVEALVLTRDDVPPLRVPFAAEGPRRAVRVWDDTVDARAVGGDADVWLSDALGVRCSLVHMPEGARRQIDREYAKEGEFVSFADGYPLLLANVASLADLSARVASPMAMERFRPNVVVSGATAWAEDGWDRISIGGIPMRGPKECLRCVITTIDPSTRQKSPEPLRTLATFRKRDDGVAFGLNLIPDEEGILRIGDVLVPNA
jgi:uncharacterized protein YcbX